jgi:hypothetical protein
MNKRFLSLFFSMLVCTSIDAMEDKRKSTLMLMAEASSDVFMNQFYAFLERPVEMMQHDKNARQMRESILNQLDGLTAQDAAKGLNLTQYDVMESIRPVIEHRADDIKQNVQIQIANLLAQNFSFITNNAVLLAYSLREEVAQEKRSSEKDEEMAVLGLEAFVGSADYSSNGNLSPEKDKTHNVKRKRKEKREEKNGKLLNSQQQNKKKKIDRLRDSKGQFIKDKETEAHDHRIRTGKQKTSQADREQALLTITTNYKLKTSAADIECPVIGCEGKYTEFINVSQHIGRAHKELKKKIMESFSSFSEFLEFYQKNNI